MAIQNFLEYDQVETTETIETNARPHNMPINHDPGIASIPVPLNRHEVSDDIDDEDNVDDEELQAVSIHANRRRSRPRRYTNVNMNVDIVEGHHQRPHPNRGLGEWHAVIEQAGRSVRDGMGRDIQTGDVLTWNSGGYYNNFWSFGIVKSINREHGRIRAINHNGKGVNIWVTTNTVIIAKRDNWDSIPHDYLVKFGAV